MSMPSDITGLSSTGNSAIFRLLNTPIMNCDSYNIRGIVESVDGAISRRAPPIRMPSSGISLKSPLNNHIDSWGFLNLPNKTQGQQ